MCGRIHGGFQRDLWHRSSGRRGVEPFLAELARRFPEPVAKKFRASYLPNGGTDRGGSRIRAERKDQSVRKTRIFLIEDNRILREGIRSVINKQADLKTVAASGGIHDVVLRARRVKPHVVLMDLGLRSENGLRVVAALIKALPNTKVIGMGLIPSQLDIVELVEAGAAGFILKEASIEDFLETIRAVARGIRILPPLLTESLFTHVAEQALRNGKKKLTEAVRMTKREREITALIAQGLSNKGIAQQLNLSTFTVKSHIHNILEKMALHSRLEIAIHTSKNTES